MTDIREIVQLALETAFAGVIRNDWITAEDLEAVDLPVEHITYAQLGSEVAAYADDRPLIRRDRVQITWYGTDTTAKAKRMDTIEAAMLEADFTPVSLWTDTGRDPITNLYTATASYDLMREYDDGAV